MAILKIKKLKQENEVTNNPNTLGIFPDYVGQLKVRTDTKQLFFAFGMTNSSWGTCGTAGI